MKLSDLLFPPEMRTTLFQRLPFVWILEDGSARGSIKRKLPLYLFNDIWKESGIEAEMKSRFKGDKIPQDGRSLVDQKRISSHG